MIYNLTQSSYLFMVREDNDNYGSIPVQENLLNKYENVSEIFENEKKQIL